MTVLAGPARGRVIGARARSGPSVRRVRAWHPEWWVYAVAAAAWLALVWMGAGMTMSTGDFAAEWSDAWSHWVLMVLAMMLLVAAPQVRTVALRSVRSRRHRSAGAYVLGYVALWVVVGAVLVAGLVALGVGHHGMHLLPVALLLAAAWQVSVPRRRVVRRCSSLRLRHLHQARGGHRLRPGGRAIGAALWCRVLAGDAGDGTQSFAAADGRPHRRTPDRADAGAQRRTSSRSAAGGMGARRVRARRRSGGHADIAAFDPAEPLCIASYLIPVVAIERTK